MTGALAAVADQLKLTLETLTGIRRVYLDPPEQVNEWPACLIYHDTGDWRMISADGGSGRPTIGGMHTFIVSVATPRKDLKRDVAELEPFNDTVIQKLFGSGLGTRFNDTVVGLGNVWNRSQTPQVRHSMVEGDWAVNTLAIRFEVDVSVEQEVA